ncbi:hypothetical protein ARMGADRAFT_669277 [Armillaria gallica]|uniref:Uncharacterized protein n=1 Tax=Armillaria gallica TaxID=47427 RepID=A0A2H3D329_ARMGA|nr:hypothetical protein ARMGADRAFT_669277 [Armillaria gallica]
MSSSFPLSDCHRPSDIRSERSFFCASIGTRFQQRRSVFLEKSARNMQCQIDQWIATPDRTTGKRSSGCAALFLLPPASPRRRCLFSRDRIQTHLHPPLLRYDLDTRRDLSCIPYTRISLNHRQTCNPGTSTLWDITEDPISHQEGTQPQQPEWWRRRY